MSHVDSNEYFELLRKYRLAAQSIEYTRCLIDEQRQLARNAETQDDEEVYGNSVLRLQAANDRNAMESNDIERKLIKAFQEANHEYQ